MMLVMIIPGADGAGPERRVRIDDCTPRIQPNASHTETGLEASGVGLWPNHAGAVNGC
jgi:hypothetical protein